MGVCDYCGETYRGFATRDGRYRFCGGLCQQRGQVLKILDHIPPAKVDAYVADAASGPCPTCGAAKTIDALPSYWVYSIVLLTRWATRYEVQCRPCARKRQLKDLLYSLGCGWWGIPFGFIITPMQVISNLVALFPRSFPRNRFQNLV